VLSCPAKFIMCMAYDPYRRCVWIGTEGDGIYQYVPGNAGGDQWHHYSKSNGLADNSCYAIAVDTDGRVWAGTDRHGVDVFVNRHAGWKRYDALPLMEKQACFGPMGSHPFAIVCDPYTNAIWIATEAGLSIYQMVPSAAVNAGPPDSGLDGHPSATQPPHTWRYINLSSGLPTNALDSIAFLPNGQVILGTQCDGVIIGTPVPDRVNAHHPKPKYIGNLPIFGSGPTYHWRVITGPYHTPDVAKGKGLPTSLINGICIRNTMAADGTRRIWKQADIYVATDSGLATSHDSGTSFEFEQGRDYAARVLGLFHPPKGFVAPPPQTLARLLPGEHITCTACDAAGNLWLGFWRDGFMVISPHGRHVYRTQGDPRVGGAGKYVQAILPLPNGKVLIGGYGGRVSAVKPAMLAAWLKPAPSPVAFTGNPNFQRPGNIKFPAPAAVPTVGQMRSLLAGLEAIPPEHDRRPRIIPLSDDWRTRGRELDNYGRLIGWMAAMNGNVDQSTTETVFKAGYQGYTDTHWRRGDHIRRWTSTAVTSDPRALQDPGTGHRNMSSWDDHGETYPVADDGPNIFFTLALPAGQYVVSLYFVNDDAHAGLWNSQRDYTISMRAVPGMPVAEFAGLPQDGRAGVASYRTARREPRSRVTEFWPGVYKRFFVSLPGKGVRLLTIRVRRNNSFNTIMSGIFVDQYPRLPKQCVVPPLILPYRPFRSYLAWKRDPYPPSILRPLARMWL
jgi:hypothetical protein